MLSFNVLGGQDKVPTGTYVDHTPSSDRYDTSDILKFKWDFNSLSQDTFYIDEAIPGVLQDTSSIKKYGWLMEGRSIIPYVYKEFMDNINLYMKKFDMVFTSDKTVYSMHERIKFVPANTMWVRFPKLYKKNKLVSMISSNNNITDGHLYRLNWMKKLNGSVDIFGRGINPITMKEFGLKDYMFSVCIENGSYETYFTEKILDCFATGTIPIYWGAPDIGDHFNLDGIIFLNDNFNVDCLSEKLYYSKMDAVIDNFNRSLNYIVLENYIYDNYLKEYNEEEV